MTEIIMEDGTKAVTDLPADQVADLQAKPAEKPAEPAKSEPTPPAPVTPPTEEPKPTDPPKPAEQKPAPEPVKPGKAKPIANLLNQRHELEQQVKDRDAQLQTERAAKADLEAKIAELSKAPQTPATADKIAELAKKYNVNADLLKELSETLRDGLTPKAELPKEVQDLIAESQRNKEIEAETTAFNTRVDKLAAVLKDEPIADQRDKLMKLAYSTDLAPDGERYSDKELSELYFGFIKPEIEPGKVSAEVSRRAPTENKVIDFQEIKDRDNPKDIEDMDSATFIKYQTWLEQQAGDVPLRHS